MTLRPDELFEREFDETRLRPGYDKEQVNTFLDRVQGELRRLVAENESLRDAAEGRTDAPEFHGGWEGPVEMPARGSQPADDGFIPLGGPVSSGQDPDVVQREADQRIMAAMHAAESAEFDSHHRVQAAQRAEAEAQERLDEVRARAARLTEAVDRLAAGGDAALLLEAAQTVHDDRVEQAEAEAARRTEHAQRQLEALEARIADARERLVEAEQILRQRADQFTHWAEEQRTFLHSPHDPASLAAGRRGRSASRGATSAWS